MDGHEVVAVGQAVQGGLGLALIVGVQLAGGAFHLYRLQAAQACDALAEGDGGDDGAVLAILVHEGAQGHAGAFRPEPDAVGGQLALRAAGLVDGVVVQDLVGQLHQVGQGLGVVAAGGQQGADDLAQVVVGRDEVDAGDVHLGLDGDVPEGGGGIDDHAGCFGGFLEVGVVEEVVDELNRLLPLDGTAGVGQDLLLGVGLIPFLQGDHVAAVAHVAGVEVDAGGGSFQGGAAGVALPGVVAEDGQDSGVTAGRETLGAVDDAAHGAFPGQLVDGVLADYLKGGLVAQFGYGVVGHAVPNDQYVFHHNHIPLLPRRLGCFCAADLDIASVLGRCMGRI